MADNLYDYLNRFNLGQLGAAGNRLLQGAANTLNRYGVGQPGGLTSLRPATGKQKLEQAWGTIPDRLNSPQGGGFGYMFGRQPNYSDAQGNIYDAVSGRLLYGVKPRTGSGSGSTGGGSLGGGSPAAERAYQAEASRVAQLTAQDPELQRYEKARKSAKTQEEMNAARDIGMQIWQQKYGNTPMGQPGGAVGSFNPLMDRTFGYQTGSAPGQQIGEPTLGPSPLIPQVDQSLNPASPNYIGGEGAPLMDFTRDEVTPELIAAYQKQLLEQAAAGRR
jgi:hypothetical protein